MCLHLFYYFFVARSLPHKKLVVKPDQLIKRRGKLGLIKVNASLDQVQQWIAERMNKDVQVLNVS